jgi:hypothetical protein
MTEVVSIKEFLQTGCFGNLYFGQPENEIFAMLGTPDYAGGITNKNKRPALFSYGDVELYVDNETRLLTCINLNYLSFWQRKYPVGGKNLQINAWALTAGLELDDLIHYLQQEEIRFCEVDPINPETRQLLISSTISLVFNDIGTDYSGLCKLWAGN